MPHLNPEQLAAVQHGTGPLRIVAQAGSGKTTALIERFAHLVEHQHIPPSQILMITFSRPAQQEMAKRIDKRLPAMGAGKSARTFHSIGLLIYRTAHKNKDDFELDTGGLLFRKATDAAARELNIEQPPRGAIKRFSGLVKNNLLGGDPALRRLGRIDPKVRDLAFEIASESSGIEPDELLNLFYKIEDIRIHSGVMHDGGPVRFVTFDDMLYETALLLRRNERLRNSWATRWQYVLQDECVIGETPILLADGSSRPISQLVEARHPGPVLSWSPHTGPVPRSINSWSKKPLTQPLVRIVSSRAYTTRDGSLRAYVGTQKSHPRYLVCTPDHPIWTFNRGWVAAGELELGDHVAHETTAPRHRHYINRLKIGYLGRQKLGMLIANRNEAGTCGTNRDGNPFGPPKRGGNGQVAPAAEAALLQKLGDSWQRNLTVPMGWSGYPRSYKLDLADPSRKIGIELDGSSHKSSDRRVSDRRKERLLRARGWTLLRYTNTESYTLTREQVEADICEHTGSGCVVDAVVTKLDPWTPKDPWVYDIGVAGTHAYFADGLLIHNCQDSNPAQAAIAGMLVKTSRNYTVVGDPAQAVFAFRGATPHSILDFERDYPGATTIIMHRNYRSGIEIVDVANRILDCMPADSVVTDDFGQAPPMHSERQTHAYVGFHTFARGRDEAEAIAANLKAHFRDGVPWEEQAVLVRMNRMTRDIEIAMATRDIPYKLVSGVSFFTLREAECLFGYARVIAQRASAEALGACLRFPSRRLRKDLIKDIASGSTEGEDWIETARRIALSAKEHEYRKIDAWGRFIEEEREVLRTVKDPSALLARLRERLELDDWFKVEGEDKEDSQSRRNLDAVVRFGARFDTVTALLDTVEEVELHRKQTARKRKAVMVSTIHRSKGKEWDVVYAPLLVAGLFPVSHADITEERRLFYVACTRARDELWLSCPMNTDEEKDKSGPSRFLDEIAVEPEARYLIGRKVDDTRVGTQMELI